MSAASWVPSPPWPCDVRAADGPKDRRILRSDRGDLGGSESILAEPLSHATLLVAVRAAFVAPVRRPGPRRSCARCPGAPAGGRGRASRAVPGPGPSGAAEPRARSEWGADAGAGAGPGYGDRLTDGGATPRGGKPPIERESPVTFAARNFPRLIARGSEDRLRMMAGENLEEWTSSV
jgi:hypothetical protein